MSKSTKIFVIVAVFWLLLLSFSVGGIAYQSYANTENISALKSDSAVDEINRLDTDLSALSQDLESVRSGVEVFTQISSRMDSLTEDVNRLSGSMNAQAAEIISLRQFPVAEAKPDLSHFNHHLSLLSQRIDALESIDLKPDFELSLVQDWGTHQTAMFTDGNQSVELIPGDQFNGWELYKIVSSTTVIVSHHGELVLLNKAGSE